ncbi:hypothetical protein ACPYO6_15495 [Georgenia sp. Z1344]|uniref:hypothetical protein n=1 Tax=Georgenia sp. Z1344 TaxID=3416706 RepID=UPI003CE73C39
MSRPPDGRPWPAPDRGPADELWPGRRSWPSAGWDLVATTTMAVVAVVVAATLAPALLDDTGRLRVDLFDGTDGAPAAAIAAAAVGLVVALVVLPVYRRWRNGRPWYEGRGDTRSMGTGAVLLVDLVQAALLTIPPLVVLPAIDLSRHPESGLAAVAAATALLALRGATAQVWAGEAQPRKGDPRLLAPRSRVAKVSRIGAAWLMAPAGPLVGLVAFEDGEAFVLVAVLVAVLVPLVSVVSWLRFRTPRPPGYAEPTVPRPGARAPDGLGPGAGPHATR